MRPLLLGFLIASILTAAPLAPASAKTAKECNAEYSANKPAIKAVEKKGDYIAACKAGNDAIPTAAAAPAQPIAPAAPAAPPPAQAAAPRPTAPAPIPAASAPSQAARPAPIPTAGVPANTSCPGSTLVWVNTKTRVYHFPGTHEYGNTKTGAYLCEQQALTQGYRASKREKHP